MERENPNYKDRMRHSTIARNFSYPLSILLITFGIFVRRIDNDTQTDTVMSPVYVALFSSVLIFLFLSRKTPIPHNNLQKMALSSYAIYFITIFLSVLLGAAIYPNYANFQFVYFLELAGTFLVFSSGYLIASRRILSTENLAWIFLCLGIYLSYAGLQHLRDVFSIQRLDLLGAKNYSAYALGLSITSATYLFILSKARSLKIGIFIGIAILLLTATLFLTGSRGGILGAFLGVLFVIWTTHLKPSKLLFIFSFFIIATAILIFFLSKHYDLDLLVSRFSIDAISTGQSTRVAKWNDTISSFFIGESGVIPTLLGQAYLYHEFGLSELQPHNLYFSALRFGGIFPALFLVTATLLTAWSIIKSVSPSVHTPLKPLDWETLHPVSFTGGIFCVIIVYTVTSGDLTRSLNFYFINGCALGFLHRTSTCTKYKRPVLR